MVSWLQSFLSWGQSLFDNFSDFERINISISIIVIMGLIGGWAFNNFK